MRDLFVLVTDYSLLFSSKAHGFCRSDTMHVVMKGLSLPLSCFIISKEGDTWTLSLVAILANKS